MVGRLTKFEVIGDSLVGVNRRDKIDAVLSSQSWIWVDHDNKASGTSES